MRRRLPWLLAIPFMVAGSFAAHGIGYVLFSPGARWEGDEHASAELMARAEAVRQTGSAPGLPVPWLIGLLAALLIVFLATRLVGRLRGRRSRGLAPSWFLMVPPLGYTLQEIVERTRDSYALVVHALHEPSFLVALALQLPFALAAYLVARALLAVAELVVRTLQGADPPVAERSAPIAWPSNSAGHRSEAAVLEGALCVRGPPLLLAA